MNIKTHLCYNKNRNKKGKGYIKMNNNLPMQSLSEVPTAKPDAKQIVALQKSSGHIVGYKLSDGQLVDKTAAIQMARQGDIGGVGISKRKGSEYLKSIPDGNQGNNLSSLPTVNS